MKIMHKVVIPLAAIIIVLIPVTGVSGDHGGGLVSIDSIEMEENIATTDEDDIALSVIVTNNDPEDEWAIKFRGLLKDPVTGEYYREADGSAQIITVRMTNVGGSSLYLLYPNETKLLELEIETSNIPYGIWSVDIGVEIFELDTYTDVITTPPFEVIEPVVPAESNETPGFRVILACSVLLLLLAGSLVFITKIRTGLILHAEDNTHDSEVQPPPDAPPSESPPPFPPEMDF